MIDDKRVHEALQRIAATPDGRVLYVGLQKFLMGVPTDSSDCALRVNLGRRSFASELMAVMAEGMTETDRDDANRRIIVFKLGQPIDVAGQRGAKRRVGPAEQPGSAGSE